jgi:hypothetical protein
MSVVRFSKRARLLSVAAFAAAWLALSAAPTPARADDATAARSREAAKQHTSSLNLSAPAAAAIAPAGRSSGGGILNAFVYQTGPQSVGFRGRVKIGKSGVYVPYYGNVDTDPLHPATQSYAGIGYGFRSWDVSVVNGGYSSGSLANVPGADTPKANPSLSFSIHF